MTLSEIVVIESYAACGNADMSADCLAICLDLQNTIQQTPAPGKCLLLRRSLLLGQVISCFHQLCTLSVGDSAERQQLVVIGSRLRSITGKLGRLRGTVNAAVPVPCRLQ